MFKKILAVLAIISFANSVFAAEENSQVEIWNSQNGQERLMRSQFKNDFFQLANFYQPQENPLYCSVATATIISNALDYGKISSQKNNQIIKPQADGGGIIEYKIYAQKTFFNDKTEVIKARDVVEYKASVKKIAGKEVYDPGLNLSDFNKMLKQGHGFKTKVTYAKKNNEKLIEEFRAAVKKIVRDDKNFIVVNFDGQVLGNKTQGHISPVVAYDCDSDSVLVLDTALHKNQWYWVALKKLYEAMNTKDGETYRGYLVISR
jgi:hypothetical protein